MDARRRRRALSQPGRASAICSNSSAARPTWREIVLGSSRSTLHFSSMATRLRSARWSGQTESLRQVRSDAAGQQLVASGAEVKLVRDKQLLAGLAVRAQDHVVG